MQTRCGFCGSTEVGPDAMQAGAVACAAQLPDGPCGTTTREDGGYSSPREMQIQEPTSSSVQNRRAE